MKKGLTAVAIIALISLTSGGAMAQEIGFNGIGGRIGFVDAEAVDATVIFGAHAFLGEIIENLALVPSIDYFSKNEVNILSVNANVRYYFPLQNSNIEPFLGGGLGFVRFDFPGVNVGGISAGGGSATEFTINLMGGADFPIQDNLVATAQLIYATEGEQLKILGGLTVLLGQ